jgi:hypothetical protein
VRAHNHSDKQINNEQTNKNEREKKFLLCKGKILPRTHGNCSCLVLGLFFPPLFSFVFFALRGRRIIERDKKTKLRIDRARPCIRASAVTSWGCMHSMLRDNVISSNSNISSHKHKHICHHQHVLCRMLQLRRKQTRHRLAPLYLLHLALSKMTMSITMKTNDPFVRTTRVTPHDPCFETTRRLGHPQMGHPQMGRPQMGRLMGRRAIHPSLPLFLLHVVHSPHGWLCRLNHVDP